MTPVAGCSRQGNVLLQLPLLAAIVVSLGCKSVTRYVSPGIEGRVVDAQTHEPIPDVRVRRVSSNEELKQTNPPKGGQLLQQSSGVRSSAAGDFKLDSVKAISVFHHIGWYSVTLVFEHPGYLEFMPTYTITDSTNRPTGEPLVLTGDVLLVPRDRNKETNQQP